MKTLETFLKEFAAFKIDDDTDLDGAGEDKALSSDDIQVTIPSQDEEGDETDADEEAVCKCCGQLIRDDEEGGKKDGDDVDSNIEIIEPEDEDGKSEFDMDDFDPDADDKDGDPMKDYNIF